MPIWSALGVTINTLDSCVAAVRSCRVGAVCSVAAGAHPLAMTGRCFRDRMPRADLRAYISLDLQVRPPAYRLGGIKASSSFVVVTLF